MLLTRRSLKDSCTAVFKLHAADTMQNIAFALFIFNVAHNLSRFYTIFRVYAGLPFLSLNCMWLTPCKILSLLFCSLHVACILQNLVFADFPLHVARILQNGSSIIFTLYMVLIVKTL